MLRTSSFAFATLLASVLGPGCAGEVLHGDGDVVTEPRAVPAFTRVVVRAELAARVTVDEAAEPSVELTADENLLGNLVVRVDAGTLIVEQADDGALLDPTAPMTAVIATGQLAALRAEDGATITLDAFAGDSLALATDGSGRVGATDVVAERVDIAQHGSGAVHVDGAAGLLLVSADGDGTVTASALLAQTADVNLHGGGDVAVRASASVTGTLSGEGDLVIFGAPGRVDVDDHGDGAVLLR